VSTEDKIWIAAIATVSAAFFAGLILWAARSVG